MLDILSSVLQAYNEYVGGYLLICLLLPAGIFFMVRLRFLNIRFLGHTFNILRGKYDDGSEDGEINHFKALSTVLSGTVGTGNIVGVALAIYIGGPGAIFWMWVTGFLGMVTKYAEVTLSLQYRKVHQDGTVSGGPMYYIRDGLKRYIGKGSLVLASLFALATMMSALGTGNMAQSNSIADILYTNYNMPHYVSGIILAILVFIVIVGGLQRIAHVTSRLVPLMAAIYLTSSLFVVLVFIDQVPFVLYSIVHDAFTGTAATGGFVGSSFYFALRYGVSRGIFSNEAGQGSAPIAFAAAKSKYPAREGMVAMLGPFIDTLIICTLTALVILLSGAWQADIMGVGMTVLGFEQGFAEAGLPMVSGHIVTIALVLFAFSTMIAWSYYGVKATEFLLGNRFVTTYRMLYVVFVFLGAVWGIDLVWHFVDASVSLMAIPNIIALFLLHKVVVRATKEYLSSF
jgi:alanine or glycine:cation symporter, AGCS family